MNPEDVSPEASAALSRALDAGHATVYVSGGTGRVEFTEDGFQAWYLAETAAIRARVADEIEAEASALEARCRKGGGAWTRRAARIARGEQP